MKIRGRYTDLETSIADAVTGSLNTVWDQQGQLELLENMVENLSGKFGLLVEQLHANGKLSDEDVRAHLNYRYEVGDD